MFLNEPSRYIHLYILWVNLWPKRRRKKKNSAPIKVNPNSEQEKREKEPKHRSEANVDQSENATFVWPNKPNGKIKLKARKPKDQPNNLHRLPPKTKLLMYPIRSRTEPITTTS